MKKILKAFLFASLVAASAATITACGKKDDVNTLNIVCYNGGFGKEWINQAAQIWQANNPDYKVNVNATTDARAVIKSNLASRNNTDDVYIAVDGSWKQYAGTGKFLELDDLIEEEVDGVKIKNKVSDEYAGSIYFKNRQGETHSYRLPWTSGVGGIYYNKTLLDRYEIEVPKTYDELIAAIDKMVENPLTVNPMDPTSKPVYPFVYTGANTDYFDYLVYTWWGQLAGTEAITTFKDYKRDSLSNFDPSQNATYAKLKQATEKWYTIFGKNGRYGDSLCDQECSGMTAENAQLKFMNGEAVMMINGDWCYNEMVKTTTSKELPADFDLRLMPTPTITGASETTKNTSYIIGEDSFIAIPKSTAKADLAKSFIKTLVSDEVLKMFNQTTNGLLGFDLADGIYSSDSNFRKSVFEYKNNCTGSFTTFTLSPLYLNGYVDIWGGSNGRPFQALISGAKANVDKAFVDNYSDISRQWNTWCNNSNL